MVIPCKAESKVGIVISSLVSLMCKGYCLTCWQKLTAFCLNLIPNKILAILIPIIVHQCPKIIALVFLPDDVSVSPRFTLESYWVYSSCWYCLLNCKGYSLSFWSTLADIRHVSFSSQNHSISIQMVFHESLKIIAVLFGQNWLIFTTWQCGVKISQCKCQSCFTRVERVKRKLVNIL